MHLDIYIITFSHAGDEGSSDLESSRKNRCENVYVFLAFRPCFTAWGAIRNVLTCTKYGEFPQQGQRSDRSMMYCTSLRDALCVLLVDTSVSGPWNNLHFDVDRDFDATELAL